MKLSVLIATVPERKPQLNKLLDNISLQLSIIKEIPNVEVLIDNDKKMFEGGKHTGQKRQDLLIRAKGEYVVFIDDDDNISNNYFFQILNAMKDSPDVITFNGYMTTNNIDPVNWEIKLGYPYDAYNGIYRRPPNHLVPIKRTIALAIGYNTNMTTGEDYDYCMRLQASGLIKTSKHINENLYHYDYTTYNKIRP